MLIHNAPPIQSLGKIPRKQFFMILHTAVVFFCCELWKICFVSSLFFVGLFLPKSELSS